MLVTTFTATLSGLDGLIISTEIDCSKGFPGWHMVGMANTAIKESKERIKAAIKNSGLEFPSNYHITVNLAPADLPKEGAGFDLPIAIGLIINTYNISYSTKQTLFIGECGLDGSIKPINGILSITLAAKKAGFTDIFVPQNNAQEALLIPNIQVHACATLTDVYNHLKGTQKIPPTQKQPPIPHTPHTPHLSHVHGQEFAKRAITIAAAGAHNILMTGPPGSGKTMLAKAIPSIMPPMTESESIEVTRIHSISGNTQTQLITQRPFRSPHHTASAVALTGGGRIPKPGEVSLAHRGILFLDEFPEFPRSVLEILRQPLENGIITISRAHGTYTYPAQCMLVAAQNPCPCGFADDPEQPCTCTANELHIYAKKISGPLLDRIDIHVPIRRIDFDTLYHAQKNTKTSSIQNNIMQARHHALNRNKTPNAQLTPSNIKKHCHINTTSEQILKSAYQACKMSGRGLHRTLKVARTIADLENSSNIQTKHIAEALQLKTPNQ